MTWRAALLAGCVLTAAAAWLPVASTAYLWMTGLGAHPYFVAASLWTKATAWTLYAPQAGANWWSTATIALSGALASLPLLASLGVAAMTHWRQKRPLHGASHFASKREVLREGRRDGRRSIAFTRRPLPCGIILGRTGPWPWSDYISFTGEGHVGLYARTRSGKGVSFVIPNCLNWGGSLVAFDIKGELWRKTAGHRRAMGQEVHCFAPSATDGRSCRYNPYSVVPRGGPRCIDMVHRINAILIPANPRTENPYWDNSARNAVNGAAVILAETPNEPVHVGAVLRSFSRPDWRDYWRGMVQRARIAGRPYPRTATDSVLSLVDDPDDKGREGVRRTIESHLGLWASPTVVAATETSDFDLTQIRKRGLSIYLCLRPTEMRRFRPLTTLLFQQLLDLNTEAEYGQDPAHTHEVLMMLDEAWAMGRMDLAADASAFVASHGFHIAYVTQTKAQMVGQYGEHGAENMFENTAVEIVFGVRGSKLAKEVSEMTGNDTVQETTHNRPRFWPGLQWGKQSESEAARRRALLLPQEVQRLSPKKQVLFRPGALPMLTSRVTYYKDRWLRRLDVAPPKVPPLRVRIAKDDGQPANAASERLQLP